MINNDISYCILFLLLKKSVMNESFFLVRILVPFKTFRKYHVHKNQWILSKSKLFHFTMTLHYTYIFEANKVRGKCNITLISLFLKHYIWLMLLIM